MAFAGLTSAGPLSREILWCVISLLQIQRFDKLAFVKLMLTQEVFIKIDISYILERIQL